MDEIIGAALAAEHSGRHLPRAAINRNALCLTPYALCLMPQLGAGLAAEHSGRHLPPAAINRNALCLTPYALRLMPQLGAGLAAEHSGRHLPRAANYRRAVVQGARAGYALCLMPLAYALCLMPDALCLIEQVPDDHMAMQRELLQGSL